MNTNQNGAITEPNGAGPLLRRWREARHLSQLELALEAEVSARHLSFLESGRAKPCRELLLTLANVLDVPLRERNVLLLAAGYALMYGETSLDDPRMAQVRAVVEIILRSNEPRSAIAHDRHWNVVMANAILVQRRLDKTAATKFFRKLLKGYRYVPRVIVTDRLKSYGAAKREILPGVKHRQHRYLNNRAENSHRSTRQRDRRMQGLRSAGHAQRFLAACGPIAQHFRPRRPLLPAAKYRHEMRQRFHTWEAIANLPTAA
jgi:putative transposase